MKKKNQIIDHSYWMRKAISLCEKSRKLDEVPVGALLVHKDSIIGSGYNLREKKQTVLAHAEMRALESFSRKFHTWRLPLDTTLYVPLEPCLMCTGALLQARLSRIVYATTDTKNAGYSFLEPWILKNKFDHQIESIPLLEFKEQTSQLLSSYFKMKRQSKKKKAAPHERI